jgi:PKD repeat protein
VSGRMGLFSLYFRCALIGLAWIGNVCNAFALTRYVSLSGSHTPPFTNWSMAATSIQAAVDAASGGDEILVTNGAYGLGGRVVADGLTNRVALYKPVALRSVNGPALTRIDGGTMFSPIRCVYMTNGASLSGFTLRYGRTLSTGDDWLMRSRCGGGVWCESTEAVVSNCVIADCTSYGYGGGVFRGTLFNCIVQSNRAQNSNGGGVYGSILFDSQVRSNAAWTGGAGDESLFIRCEITDNDASYEAGAVICSTLSNCVVTGNGAYMSGAAIRSHLYDCVVNANTAVHYGAVSESTLRNCVLQGNKADIDAAAGSCELVNCLISSNQANVVGGASCCALVNCTVVGNQALIYAGGVYECQLTNCIVYYNSAPAYPNWLGGRFVSSVSAPRPDGEDNLDVEPGIAGISNPRLLTSSPCIDRGVDQAWMTDGVDLDGQPRIIGTHVDLGAYEFFGSGLTGTLAAAVSAVYTQVAVGYAAPFSASIAGHAQGCVWDFQDGETAADRRELTHAFASSGVFAVTLAASNLEHMVSATTTIQVVERQDLHVAADGNDLASGFDWDSAKATLQAAVDAAFPGAQIWVSNGAYSAGGRAQAGGITNRLLLNKPVFMCSVNGPLETSIEAEGSTSTPMRCVYVGAGAGLSGFTLRGGCACAGDSFGGGAYLAYGSLPLSNCLVVGNMAGAGGGLFGGQAVDCEFRENEAVNGGGLYAVDAVRCRVVSNTADKGGGAYLTQLSDSTIRHNQARNEGGGLNMQCRAVNCLIQGNTAASDGGGAVNSCVLYNCLLTDNAADHWGGGVVYGQLFNCTIAGNSSRGEAGGVYAATLYNSIVYYNEAPQRANHSYATGYSSCSMPEFTGSGNRTNDPCLVSLANPRLLPVSPCIDAGVNSSWMSDATDLDGGPRIVNGIVDLGAREFSPVALTGVLSAALSAAYTQGTAGLEISFDANITGNAQGYVWDFGDGTILTNLFSLRHAYANPGVYDIVLSVSNLTDSITTTMRVEIVGIQTYYVATNGNDGWPGTSWLEPKATIQAAVDAALPGSVILVSNGCYDSGPGYVLDGHTNRVGVYKPLSVVSVNGPAVTTIEGRGPMGAAAIRGVYLCDGASLSGFTVSNGFSSGMVVGTANLGGGILCSSALAAVSNCVVRNCEASHGGGLCGGRAYDCVFEANTAVGGGGGAYGAELQDCELANNVGERGGGAHGCVLNDCLLAGNTAWYGGGCSASRLDRCRLLGNVVSFSYGAFGGGAFESTLYNCEVTGNHALGSQGYGGGALDSEMLNCTVASNSARYGGGIYAGKAVNSIVYYNTADDGANYASVDASNVVHSCTTPAIGGPGNITNAPVFADLPAGDLRLDVGSPCIDRGLNEAWMLSARDLAGAERLVHGSVDMGAREFRFEGQIRVLLQGPYEAAGGMRTLPEGNIPLTSPYADDPRTVASVPSNVVDWVLVQARAGSPSNAPSFSRSLFVRDDGWVVDESGGTNLLIEVAPMTLNFLCVAHRQHPMAMSVPRFCDNPALSFDLTAGPWEFLYWTNGILELEPGVWGLPAGDADADGKITAVDQAMAEAQVGQSGYKCGDFDLDGVVSLAGDVERCFPANLRLRSATPHSELALSPSLSVSPARKTAVTESSVMLTASGLAHAWFTIENPSGGSLHSPTATSIVYQAGTTSSCVDVVEAWDGDYRFGRSHLNIISVSEMALAGKAVIVAGRAGDNDALWPATAYLADEGYNTLIYRGFAGDSIHYLSPASDNGQVDMDATYENTRWTFTNWIHTADKLFVYLVDHGARDFSGSSYFRLNSAELLPARDIDGWLDAFQDTYHKDVTIVVDCCYAASLLSELSYTGAAKRIVLAASGENEPAYFIAGGLISFSDALFSGVMSGQDLADAYQAAASAMSAYQHGAYYDNAGGGAASNFFLGSTFVSGKDAPRIGQVCGDQLLDHTTEAFLWASDVISAYSLERIWCMIVPPTHLATNPAAPVTDIPELELSYNHSKGRYEGSHNGFSGQGAYKVIFYAQDVWGSVSPPRQSYVVQNGFDEKVILVAGGDTNWPSWSGINNLGNYAFGVLSKRGLGFGRLFYLSAQTNQDLSGDGGDDVNALPTREGLHDAITNWAAGADALTIYLVGEGTGNGYVLNAGETLEASALDLWLDEFQGTARVARVVMDFAGAGGFIPVLAPLSAPERISIASCRASRESVKEADGMLSFSRFFFSEVKAGRNLQESFRRAQYGIRRASGGVRQGALIDDNGNGIPNEKNIDGVLSCSRYLGPAFITGAEPPVVGSIMSDTELTNATTLMLWASEVTDAQGISNVWCVITPPNYGWASNSVQTHLAWNAGQGRYEAEYAGFSVTGTYVCTYYAQNLSGDVSSPRQSWVRVAQPEGIGPDLYEPDNDRLQARAFVMGEIQTHSLHHQDDEDWISFYAISNILYDLETVHLTNQIDTVLELYSMDTNGALHRIDRIDEYGYDQGEIMGLDRPTNGLYFVRISSTNYLEPGVYTLTVTPTPSAGQGDIIWVIAYNGLTCGGPPPGVRARLCEGVELDFNGQTSVSMGSVPDGVYTITLTGVPEGWEHAFFAPSQVLTVPPARSTDVSAGFNLMPTFRVTGAVRDAWTGEWLPEAVIGRCALGSFYSGYSATNFSQADGTFCSTQNYWALDWQFTLSKSGYSNLVFNVSGSSLVSGSVTNLGACRMMPIDTQGQGLPDAWVLRYFGPGTNVLAQADPDQDGQNNLAEYLVGTDPTHEVSFLQVSGLRFQVSESNRFTLSWPVASGRSYSVYESSDLLAPEWALRFGPQTASNSQDQMQWIDDNIASTDVFFRIEVEVP